ERERARHLAESALVIPVGAVTLRQLPFERDLQLAFVERQLDVLFRDARDVQLDMKLVFRFPNRGRRAPGPSFFSAEEMMEQLVKLWQVAREQLTDAIAL